MAIDDTVKVDVPLLDDFLATWFTWCREDGGIPEWSRFRPFHHPHLLPHVMLYEQMEDRFRCALVGEQVRINLPINLAGRFIDEAMPPQNLADITGRLNEALTSGKPNFVEKTMAWEPGYDLVCYCALQIPFSGREGRNPRILSILSFRFQRI